MSEALRSKDDGTEGRPYGGHSVCGTCRYGKAWVECQHSWRSALEPSPVADEDAPWKKDGAPPMRVRVYVVKHNCEHPKMSILESGRLVCPTMHDVVKCEMWEERPS